MELLAGKIDIFPYLTEEQASQLTASYSIEVGSTQIWQQLRICLGKRQHHCLFILRRNIRNNRKRRLTNLVQAMFLNNQAEPLNDIRVRQALCYAVNRQEILDMLSGGRGPVFCLLQ